MTINSKSIVGQGWDSTLTAKQSVWVERAHSPRIHARGPFTIKGVVDRAIESEFIRSDDGIKLQLAIANAVGNDVVIPERFEIIMEARTNSGVGSPPVRVGRWTGQAWDSSAPLPKADKHVVAVRENDGGYKDIIDFPPPPGDAWGRNFNKAGE